MRKKLSMVLKLLCHTELFSLELRKQLVQQGPRDQHGTLLALLSSMVGWDLYYV